MTRLNAFFTYAGIGAVLTVLVAVIASAMSGQANAIWLGAGLAYVIQLIAFAFLLKLRGHATMFMTAWLAGMILRFGAVALCALWLYKTDALPRGPTLLSLVGILFMLVLLEPLFLRWDLRGS
jgi:hypothetical protein